MIRYALKCTSGHAFDSWFQSAAAFDGLQAAGHVACPVCGATDVEKALMAPPVRPARGKAGKGGPPADTGPDNLRAPSSDVEKAIARLRRKIEAESDYVGLSFASEARRMHDGDIPHRSIYGEARPADAKELIEDGVPVAPLPFLPNRKAN